MDKEKLVKSIKTIQEYCFSQDGCSKCPLYDYDGHICLLEGDPMCWMSSEWIEWFLNNNE